jgi:hypothetical protein
MEAPISEDLIKSELEQLQKEQKKKLDSLFDAGMIRGKIQTLEAVLDNIELGDLNKIWDKVWWNRHHAHSEHDCRKTNGPGCKPAFEMEKKYGRDNMIYTDYQWGVLNGKFSAIRWLHGDEWDTLDT